MEYQITEQLLEPGRDHNRPGTPLHPVGIVLHETATPNATDEAEAKYFAGGYRAASAHYFVDADSITRLIPESEQAWHAGPTANQMYLSIEMCHIDARFEEIWARTIWLAADICRRHGWNPATAIVTHEWISQRWHETTHTDPAAYLAAHGKTMELFRADVAAAMASAAQTATPIIALVDGHELPAVLVGDKSYIATRDLASVLGYIVSWDQAKQRVVLTRP